jgi:AcrR family transcriptional regulator
MVSFRIDGPPIVVVTERELLRADCVSGTRPFDQNRRWVETMPANSHDVKRERILDEARDLLRHFGLRKVTMEDIARKARMAKASLYYYFPSREHLFREIIRREGSKLWERLHRAVAEKDDPRDQLRAYAQTRFRALTELSIYYKTLTAEDYLRHYEFIEREREAYTQLELQTIENILREGVRRGIFRVKDTRLAAFAIIQAMKGLEYPLISGQGVSLDGTHLGIEEAIDMMLDLLLKGIEVAPRSEENHGPGLP